MYRHVIAYTVTDSSAICVAYCSSECIAYSEPYAGAYTSTYASTYASTYGIAHEQYECHERYERVTDFITVSCTIGIAYSSADAIAYACTDASSMRRW